MSGARDERRNDEIGAIRRRACADLADRTAARPAVRPALNPLAQLGALGFFFFWIVAVSGIYLFIFFDTGIERAYQSVENLTQYHWYHAGVMRSFHRYASDLMVVMLVDPPAARVFASTTIAAPAGTPGSPGCRSSGCSIPRASPAIGWCGTSSRNMSRWSRPELLDWLPIFGEPIARNFVAHGHAHQPLLLADGVHAHRGAAVPAVRMWIHILRISRPEGESAARAGDPDAGRAGRSLAVESGGLARPRRPRQDRRPRRPRLALPAALSADRPVGQRRGVGVSRRLLADGRR